LRPLRLIGYIALVAAFFGLASGQLLHFPGQPGELYLYPVALGVLSLSVALAVYGWKRSGPTDRLLVAWTCAGVLVSIQLSGGYSSLFYPVYFLCLLWVSLPSIGGSAMEMGLLGGLTAALALLNASLWGDAEEPLLTRLVPLLLPSMKLLLVPFLFGLAADWMAERDISDTQEGPRRSRADRSQGANPPAPSDDYRRHLLEILHRHAGASLTCLFLKHGDDFFRLEVSFPEGGDVIPRYLLPTSHRLARMLAGMGEPVSIGMDSPAERRELLTYRRKQLPEDAQVWLTLCPLSSRGGGAMAGLLLQDFVGGKPKQGTSQDLQSAALILLNPFRGAGPAVSTIGDDAPWIARLVTAGTQETLDDSVHGLASLLSEAVPDSTISVAAVDSATGKAGVWVSRGPLASWRREQTCTGGGIAGWVMKNRAPCCRTRMNAGPKSLHAFADTDDIPAVVGSCLGVPVMTRGELGAIIIAEHESDDIFGRSQESLLLAAAGLMSMAMELDDLRSRCNDSSDLDNLSRLPRITQLDLHLRHLASQVQSFGWSVGVIVADIDGFSEINRKLGYSSGDQLIREASRRFRGFFREEIFVARVGTDSFAACIPKVDRADLEAFLPRLFEAMSWNFTACAGDSDFTKITVSIGACHSKINRKVLLLAAEAAAAADEASAAGPGSQILRRIGISGREDE
jgi:diguanylate cyclase (GGDEF)-like protein